VGKRPFPTRSSCAHKLVTHKEQKVCESCRVCCNNEFQQAMGRPFNLERLLEVTCDAGYFCANFRLHKTLFSRIRQDVRDRQRSGTHDCLTHPTLIAGHNNESSKTSYNRGVSACGETTFSHKVILYAPISYPIRKNTDITGVFLLVGKRRISPTRPSCAHE